MALDDLSPYKLRKIFICSDYFDPNMFNFFSITCQKNGYNKNPIAWIFWWDFRKICIHSSMKCSEKCNCENDDDEFLNVNVLKDFQIDTPLNDGDTT